MIHVIVGPTGSGKTSLACKISSKFDLPIINADAFQIYRDMDIGTAKIDKNDPLYQKHFLIDIISPFETYSVKQYRDDFDKIINDLISKNKEILICGGTGLYIKGALYDYSFPEIEIKDEHKYDDFSNEELYKKLINLDPESAKNIHQNNRKRVIRALNIIDNSELTKSENIARQNHELRFNKDEIEILFLNPNREELYSNINERVDKMFEDGLINEVENLLKKYDLSLTASQAIGYKEVIDYINGNISLEECKELIKKRSRNYAKRQITFFKHQFDTIEFNNKQDLFEYLLEKLK